MTNVNNYTWDSETSTALDRYGSASNAVTVLENSTTTITYNNYYKASTTSVTLKKVDSEDESLTLRGATFSLENGKNAVGSYTTNENGEIAIDSLAYGTEYTLTETTALDGYNLLTDSIVFVIDTDGIVTFRSGNDDEVASSAKDDNTGTITIIVKNEAGYVLPYTGGSGTAPYALAGLALCIGAGALLLSRRKVRA